MKKELEPSCEDTSGPYYAPSFVDPHDHDLTSVHGFLPKPEGTPVFLEVSVLDVNRKPVAPVLIETWQADSKGRRRVASTLDDATIDPWFSHQARHYCEDGVLRLTTIRPGATTSCLESPEPRAPYVSINIFCDGIARLATQIFFSDSPENDSDPLLLSLPDDLRPRLIARRVENSDVHDSHYALTIVLRGDDETPFFEDYYA